jgi:hypothetical protein
MSPSKPTRVSRLAQRFQAAIDREVAAKRIAEEQARQERALVEQARRELLDALAAFGEAVSWFEVLRDGDALELRYQERRIRFEPVGERGKVKVVADGLEGDHKLFFQDGLNSWVWSREDRYGREHRELLFDAGLERLVSAVFEIAPMAEEELQPEPVLEPAAPSEDAAAADAEAVPFPEKTL